jgi:uncharacterized protein YdhG (YjbR/CyaY superfamily)
LIDGLYIYHWLLTTNDERIDYMDNKITYESIDEYISKYPYDIQKILNKLREAIKEAAPGAQEKISYQMPTFALYGNLVHFAAHKSHIGFYPTPSGVDAFKDELLEYKTAKGSVQFPIDRPLPYEIIREIVKFRVAENKKRATAPKATANKAKTKD